MDLPDLRGLYQTGGPVSALGLTPLVIYDDGSVDIAGTVVPTAFGGQTLEFGAAAIVVQDRTVILQSGQVTFDASGTAFAGEVTVDNQLSLPYYGTSEFQFAAPTLASSVDASAALETGDGVMLQAANGMWVGNSSNGIDTFPTQPGFWWNITLKEAGICLDYDGSYWVGDTTLTQSGSLDDALVFAVKMTANGKLLLQSAADGRYVVVRPDGLLGLASEGALAPMMEFDPRISPVAPEELLARWGIEPMSAAITACELDIANLCWQCTGGLWLALGIGPYMAGSTDPVKVGVMGILRTNAAVWGKVTAAWEFLKANPGATATVIAGLAAGILSAAWAAGLLWKLIKLVLVQVGWWILFRIVAHILEAIFLPEAEIAQLLASFIIWAASLVNLALRISQDCAAGYMAVTTPARRWTAVTAAEA